MKLNEIKSAFTYDSSIVTWARGAIIYVVVKGPAKILDAMTEFLGKDESEWHGASSKLKELVRPIEDLNYGAPDKTLDLKALHDNPSSLPNIEKPLENITVVYDDDMFRGNLDAAENHTAQLVDEFIKYHNKNQNRNLNGPQKQVP